jgi:predicted P-loop ATPase
VSVLEAALEYLAAGITTIPIAMDGSKAPFTFPGDKGPFKWQPLSKKRPTEAQIRKLFKHASGIAILGGPVSGDLEIIDFDLADRFDMFAELAAGLAPGLLELCPVVKTPNGYHLYLRAPNIQGNLKLARTREHYGAKKSNVAVETRGVGGYVLAPPSPAECHPSGKLYEHHSGPKVTDVPTLTAEQRDTLISIARSLNEVADDDKSVAREEAKPRKDDGSAKKPGEDFDERATWHEVLEPHGWSAVHRVGDKTYWRRPGKQDGGISATTGHCGTKLWVFSSNAAPFDAERAYNKFSAYGLLNCGGDFAQASRELRAKGYGSPLERKVRQLEPVRPTPAKWDELNAGLDRINGQPPPPALEAPPLDDSDAPHDITPSIKAERMTAERLEFMMDNDIAAVMRPGIFERVLAIESEDKAEWLLVCDLLRRRKQKDSFNRAVKEHKRKARVANHSDGWRGALTYRTNNDGDQILDRSLANISLILREDAAWKGVLALNTMSNRIVTRDDTPFERDPKVPWSDNDSLATRAWLESNYGLQLKTNDAHEGVILAASIQKFNPLVEYLDGLESHDKELLDTWLVDIFGVEDTPYARAVGRRWMISAVARALDPGCKADCVLILEGDQGMKKSSVLAQLCPSDSWFIDGLSDFGSKDQKEEIEGKWIVELGELKGFGKELEAIKAFTSRTTEKYRPSYARFTVEAPRTCVFAGTVNPDNVGYFRDVTGNRRFWPVRCRKLAPTITPELRDRLWAEARDAYRAGFAQKERDETTKWWIDPHERDLYKAALEQQEARVEVDVWHDSVAHYLIGRDDTSVNEILAHIGISLDKLKQVEGQRVGRILRMLRWEKYRANNVAARPWRYRAPGGNLSLLADVA